MKSRLVLLLMTLAWPAFGQQAKQEQVAVQWGMFGTPLPGASRTGIDAHSMLFGASFTAAPASHIEAQSPSLVGFALKVGTPQTSVELFKPVHVIAPGLAPPQSAPMPLAQTLWGTYYAPQPFSGLVSLVSAIRLNLQSPSDAQEGFTWSLMYGGSYNGQTDVGMSMRYKVRF